MFIRVKGRAREKMRAANTDESLRNTLDWALDRMRQRGYNVKSQVVLNVEPGLAIMGYARKDGKVHKIMISEWALDSEMLGGLVLHELAHVYFTERGACSHDSRILERVLEDLKARDGLRAKETECLIDAFNHLQNILVDDVVFAVMGEKEQGMVRRFFGEWVTDRPSGDPVTDAALLCRNAFAVASLKRRGLFEDRGEMHYRNASYLAALGSRSEQEFGWLENFLETASVEWDSAVFREALETYFDKILSLTRSTAKLDDLR